MKRYLLTFLILSTFLFSSFLFPFAVLADTYGSGTYGSGLYSAQNSSNTNPIASAITAVGNSISSFFCSSQAPSSAPNLYEIDVTSTTATVYFSPAGGPYDSHFIAYGQGNNSEGYGINLTTSQSPGALFYKIEHLSPSTVYTFKVRGGNGCKPGPWSNTLTIQTRSSTSRTTGKFYPNHQAQYVTAQGNWWTQTQNFVGSIFPTAPNTGLAPAKEHTKLSNSHTTHKSSQSSNAGIIGMISNFFTNLFH